MKPEEQRIAIAKACGWTQPENGYWRSPTGEEYQVMHGWQTYKDGTDIIPNYLGDCDAMHEALGATLTCLQLRECFLDNLGILCSGEVEYQGDGSYCEQWLLVTATAQQLADALLQTLGLEIDDT